MEDYFTAPGRCGRTADLTSDLRYFADHDFGASFFARVPVVFTEFIFYSFEFSTALFTLFYDNNPLFCKLPHEKPQWPDTKTNTVYM